MFMFASEAFTPIYGKPATPSVMLFQFSISNVQSLWMRLQQRYQYYNIYEIWNILSSGCHQT